LRGEYDIEVELNGFELHPEVPAGGVAAEDFFAPGQIEPMRKQMRTFAEGFDVEIGSPPRISNTRAALAVAEYARDQGKLDAFWSAAMHAHWRDGRDLEDDEMLEALANDVGLDAKAAVEASRSPEYIERVDQLGVRAAEADVTGIPAFLFPEERIVGCQPYERLAKAAEQAGATKR
jgi:predicted DsbA family dithiol-disulfide isomerase